MIDLEPIWLSLKLSLATVFILALLCIPLAYYLNQWKSNVKIVVESIISLPIVLPPTVLGFYLLILFSPNSFLGKLLATFDWQLAFTFQGILIASLIYSFPFMLLPILRGFELVPQRLYHISYTLGKSKWQTLIHVILPNIKYSIVTSFILTFAHTIGEFGVILMIGGNIPGETRVASLAIYDEIEALNYSTAHMYAFILLLLSFIIIVVMKLVVKKGKGLRESIF